MYVFPEVEQIEFLEAERNTERTRIILGYHLEDLSELAKQWSRQRIVATLLKQNHQDTLSAFFSNEKLKEEKLHLFFLINERQQVLWHMILDPQTQEQYPLLNLIQKLKQLKPSFMNPNELQQNINGLYLSERGPLLLTSRSIYDDNNKLLGWVMIGRFLTQETLDRFTHTLRTDIKLWPMGVKVLPEKIDKILPVIQANPRYIHTEKTENIIKAYTSWSDINGEPSIVLMTTTPRNASIIFKESIKNGYAVLLAADFVLVLLLIKILQHAIVKPTHRLTHFIQDVIDNIDAPPRIKSNRNDELGILTQALNDLITQFCVHKTKTLSKAYQFGMNRAKTEMVDELSNHIKNIIPLTENLERRLWTLSLDELEQLIAEIKASSTQELDFKGIKNTLEKNNQYLRDEMDVYRGQVRKIKERILRIGTIIKGYALHIKHDKEFYADEAPKNTESSAYNDSIKEAQFNLASKNKRG